MHVHRREAGGAEAVELGDEVRRLQREVVHTCTAALQEPLEEVGLVDGMGLQELDHHAGGGIPHAHVQGSEAHGVRPRDQGAAELGDEGVDDGLGVTGRQGDVVEVHGKRSPRVGGDGVRW